MQDRKKVVALLTGRGNNTLKDKNVLLICGKPLLYYPAIAAKKSKYISAFYVSSDDEKILGIANELGYKKIVRTADISGPNAQHIDAITHAIEKIKTDGVVPDILVVLLANSATIKTNWIDECLAVMLSDENLSAIVPVNEDLDHHPYRAKRVDQRGFLEPFFDFANKKISTNRQDLQPSYFLCHNFWVLNVKKSVFSTNGQQPWQFMGDKVKPYIIEKCHDIHSIEDVDITEKWVKENILGQKGTINLTCKGTNL